MLFRKSLPATHLSYRAGILKFTVFAQIAADLPTRIAICADSTGVKESWFRARSVPQSGCFQKIYNDILRQSVSPEGFEPLFFVPPRAQTAVIGTHAQQVVTRVERHSWC